MEWRVNVTVTRDGGSRCRWYGGDVTPVEVSKARRVLELLAVFVRFGWISGGGQGRADGPV